MANNNKHTGPNVPALRFPEFSGEWSKDCLNEFLEVQPARNTQGIYSKDDVLSVSGDYGVVNQIKLLGRSFAGKDVSNYHIVRTNDIVYTKSPLKEFPYGIVKTNQGTAGIVSTLYAVYSAKSNTDPKFVEYYFSSKERTNKYFKPIVRIGAKHDMKIGNEEVLRNIVVFPSKQEQNKIQEFLRIIDERIATQSKIIEELTTLRSALYDSMFCAPEQEMPKFRIQSFSGKWQLRQLNEICSRKSIKNKDNLYSRVLTIAAQHGLVDQESFFKKRIASENLESYLCLEKGDFAYNKSYSSDYPWGAVKRLSNFDKGIISPLYICFTPKPEVVDPDYLAHYFESTKWHSGISEISGEGARNHGLLNMSVIDYFNTCHRIPGLDEQKAIARRLNAIAHKLQTEQEYLELLNRQKDCFLKQMFI